jgi:hypothetical protein
MQRQDRERTHLFILRVWMEEIAPEQVEWRGRVQHVPGGEWYYFRDWAGLLTFLQATLPAVCDGER